MILKNCGGETEWLHEEIKKDPYISPGTKLYYKWIICLKKKKPDMLDRIEEKVGEYI